jgi:hypothetical protein
MKSFRPKDGSGEPPSPGRNGERNFHKEKRSNETHASTTDPDARLYRKADGRESRLCFIGHVLMENRNGLAVDATLTCATGTAEREAALAMIDRRASEIPAASGYARVTANQSWPAATHTDRSRSVPLGGRDYRFERPIRPPSTRRRSRPSFTTLVIWFESSGNR